LSDRPSEPTLLEDLLEEVEGILSMGPIEPGLDPEGRSGSESLSDQDTFDLLAAGQALKRLPPGRERDRVLARIKSALNPVPTEVLLRAVELVRSGRWLREFDRLQEVYEQEIGLTHDRRLEREFAEEARRLFQLADRWRLGLLGILARTDHPALLRTRTTEARDRLEKGPVERVLTRPDLFVDAGGIAERWFGAFREDLFDTDEELGVTQDIFAAVASVARQLPAVLPRGDPQDGQRTAAATARDVRGGAERPKLDLPPVLPAAFAKGGQSPRLVFLAWESPDGAVWARLAFAPSSPEGEERERVELVLRERNPGSLSALLQARSVRMLGLSGELMEGRASFRKADIRRAADARHSPSLEVLDPESGAWVAFRMIRGIRSEPDR
jgi:hypothetical protein